MKCTSCGAEIGNSKVCEYCGSHISVEMQKEQEQLNKLGCPNCGSTDIQFTRENVGEIHGKSHKQVVHRTVGLCNNCGYTWYPQSEATPVYKKRKTWLWVLGWLFCFPIPLTILLLRRKQMNPILKYGIIAVAWIIYFIIGFSKNKTESSTVASTIDLPSTSPTISTTESLNEYSSDSKVNQFIVEYNAMAKHEMTDFTKGNIKQKMYGHANECVIEMLNPSSTSGYSFVVKIHGGNTKEKTEKMLEVFPDVIHVLDNSITDEQIEQAIYDFKNDPSSRGGDYQLGDDLSIAYYSLVFSDDGSWIADSRVEIDSINYGE